MKKVLFKNNYNFRNLTNFLYIIIPFSLIATVKIYPFIKSIYYSFTNFNGRTPPSLVGLRNYLYILDDAKFLTALKNNLIISTSAPIFIFIPLLFALLLFNYKGIIIKSARMVILLPYAMSMTVAGVLFSSLLYIGGPISTVLRDIGLDFLVVDWLGKPSLGLMIVIMTAFWKDFGLFTLIYLAALANLDKDIIDAAKIDGASWRQEFMHVLLPQMSPILVLVTALVLIIDFKGMFDYVFNITMGGPGYSTFTIEFLLYQEGFVFFNMGIASTIGIAIFLIVFTLTSLQIRLMSRFGSD